jgi:hypothetical protein
MDKFNFIPNYKFYEFSQNNSRGSFQVTDNLAHRVIVEAASEDDAIDIAENLGCYWDGCANGNDCDCCGDRWYASPSEIIIGDEPREAFMYTHKENHVELWQQKYGNFTKTSDPVVVKEKYGTIYGTTVILNNIDEYCQYIANTWGWTQPDVILHYKNGTKVSFNIQGQR